MIDYLEAKNHALATIDIPKISEKMTARTKPAGMRSHIWTLHLDENFAITARQNAHFINLTTAYVTARDLIQALGMYQTKSKTI